MNLPVQNHFVGVKKAGGMADNRDVQKRQPDVLADALQGLATPNKGKPLEAAYRRPKRMNKFIMLMIKSSLIY